jgi:hypothetical protein
MKNGLSFSVTKPFPQLILFLFFLYKTKTSFYFWFFYNNNLFFLAKARLQNLKNESKNKKFLLVPLNSPFEATYFHIFICFKKFKTCR